MQNHNRVENLYYDYPFVQALAIIISFEFRVDTENGVIKSISAYRELFPHGSNV